jgi:hypothetical protein
MVAAALIGAPAAVAQVPAGCSASQLHLDISQTPSLVRPGDLINYSVFLDNIGAAACDVHNVGVTLQLPSTTGVPSPVGAPVASFAVVPAQFARLLLGTFPYTVPTTLVPGVTVLRARTAVLNGQLQDVALSPVNINKEISAVVFTPSITIDKVGSITGPAPAPQTVTYTFYVRNGSNPALDPATTALSNVTVTDDKCGNPTYLSGDTNSDGKLETTETWAFQCTLKHPSPGTYTNVATAHGQNILNNRPVPVVSPPDTWTVVLTGPPAGPPQPAVKPTAPAPGRCVTLPSRSLKVRAHEFTTLKVRVRLNGKNIAKSVVHVRGAGVSKRGRTNKNGLVTFHVRPAKKGRLRISSDQCAVAARLAVKPARQVVAPALPRVTG